VKASKQPLFEKSGAKTFSPGDIGRPIPPGTKVFLLLFFRKRSA
jgi:hypothetical protein